MQEKNIDIEEELEEKKDRHSDENKSGESEDSKKHNEKSGKKADAKKEKLHQIEAENEQLTKELEEAKENYLRLSAEFQNLRKRFEREKEDIVLYANEKLIEMILPILDDFERSLTASDKTKSFESFRNGIELIYKNLREALEKEGVKPINAVGQDFDHNLHDALMLAEKDDAKAGTVVEEVQKGYYYKEKVLRHSKVIVAK